MGGRRRSSRRIPIITLSINVSAAKWENVSFNGGASIIRRNERCESELNILILNNVNVLNYTRLIFLSKKNKAFAVNIPNQSCNLCSVINRC